MPCMDGGPGPSNDREYILVSQLLCYTMNCYRKGKTWKKCLQENPKLQAWVIEHDQADAEREQKEKAQRLAEQTRKQAIAKLTPEERNALGIH